MKATVNIETVTVVAAHQMLSNMVESQRNKRPYYIKALAAEMRDGRWKLSPDCLLLVRGKLANGQHRLTALVEVGKSQQFIVMRCDDEELYSVLDCGKARTLADGMAVEYASVIASAARKIIALDKGLGGMKTGGHGLASITRGEQWEFIQANESGLRDVAELANRCYMKAKHESKRTSMTPSVAATLAFIGNRIDAAKTKAFIETAFSGEPSGNAAWMFRESMIGLRFTPRPFYCMGMGIKAMNAYFAGQRPKLLKLAETEDFPKFQGA